MARPRKISDGPTHKATFTMPIEDYVRAKLVAISNEISVAEFFREAVKKKMEENDGTV